MKTNLLGLFLILIITSCATKKAVNTTVEESKTKVTEQRNIDPFNLILGNWKMESYQVYSPDPDPRNSKEIFWEFKEKNEMLVSSYEGKNATANTHNYWMNQSILNVNGTLYMYSFKETRGLSRGDDAKPFGDELWLDSNLDPSISAHGPLIHFTRVK